MSELSAQLKPHTPSAMCLMAAQAVCLWTRSLKQNQTQQLQYDTQLCTYSKIWNCKSSETLLLNCDTLKSFSSLVTLYHHHGLAQLYCWLQLITALFTAFPYTIYLYPYPTECSTRVLLNSYWLACKHSSSWLYHVSVPSSPTVRMETAVPLKCGYLPSE